MSGEHERKPSVDYRDRVARLCSDIAAYRRNPPDKSETPLPTEWPDLEDDTDWAALYGLYAE